MAKREVKKRPYRWKNGATVVQGGTVSLTVRLDPEAQRILSVLAPYRAKGQFISRLIGQEWARLETRQEALLEWQRRLVAGGEPVAP